MTNINEEFEVYIIGVCLNEPTTLPKIMLDLKPNDFLTQNNRIIFSAICEMHNQKAKEIDAKTLISFISNNSSYKVDNCEQLIEEINSSYISSSKLDSYIVNQKVISANRKIKNLGKKMMNCEINVGNYQKEIDEINEEVKNIYSDVHTSSLKDISDITPIIEGRIDAVKKGINDHTVGVRSGFFYYDECTYGFINGSINVFAARPGVGKTAFMLNSVLNAAYQVKANSAKYDKPPAIIIFSLEMKAEELWNRLASIVCNKRFSTKFKKEWTAEDERMFNTAKNTLNSLPIKIEDRSNITVGEIRNIIDSVALENSVALVCIDYLGLIHSNSKTLPQHVAVGENSKELKRIAKDYNTPIFLLVQLNRSAEAEDDPKNSMPRIGVKRTFEPKMSMLRESGQIEADADTITFLWPDNTAKPEGEENAGQYNSIKLVDFHILKNRDGEQRKFTLSFDGELSKFTAPKKDK